MRFRSGNMLGRKNSPSAVAAQIQGGLKSGGSSEHAAGVQWFFQEEVRSHGWYTGDLRRAVRLWRRDILRAHDKVFLVRVAGKLSLDWTAGGGCLHMTLHNTVPGRFAQIFALVYNRGLPMDLAAIQSALRERNIDAWLFYDHHHRDPIAYRVLGLPTSLMVTRRWFYLIPAEGEPVKLVHKIEAGHLDSLPGKKHQYSGWQELFDQAEGDPGETSRSRHAVLAEQQRVHDFAGGWRHDRPAARPGQERGQFGGPGGAVRIHLERRADPVPLRGARQHRFHCGRGVQRDRAARAQRRHQGARDSAVVHGSLSLARIC